MILAIVLLTWWAAHSPQTVTEVHGHAKGWRYDLVNDRFAGGESCKLSRGGIDISRGFATFNLGKDVDTADALYRVDNGPVKPWRTLAPRLVAAGVKIQDDSVANPSRGQVILPLADIIAGREVDIRPAGRKNPRRFKLVALAPAVDLAALRGCQVETKSQVAAVPHA
jgi:hypothetical protein